MHFYRLFIAFVLFPLAMVVVPLCYSSTIIDRHYSDGSRVQIEINDAADPQGVNQWQVGLLLPKGFDDRKSILCFNAPVAPADSNSIAISVTNDLSDYCYQLVIMEEEQTPIFQHVSQGSSENGTLVRLKSTTTDRPALTSVTTDQSLKDEPHPAPLTLLVYSDNMTDSGPETGQTRNNTLSSTGGKFTGTANFPSGGNGGFFYLPPPPPWGGGGGRPSGLFEIDLVILNPVINWLMSIGKDSISFQEQPSPARLKMTRVNADGTSSEAVIPVGWLDFLDINQLTDVNFWNTLLKRADNSCPASESLQWQLGCLKLFLECNALKTNHAGGFKAGNGDGEPTGSPPDKESKDENNYLQKQQRDEPEGQESRSPGEGDDGSEDRDNRKDDNEDEGEGKDNTGTQDLQVLANQLVAIIESNDPNAVYKLRQILDELDMPERLQVLETKSTNTKGNTVTPLEAVLKLRRTYRKNSVRNRFIEQLIEATSNETQALNDLGPLSTSEPIIPPEQAPPEAADNNLMILYKIVQDIIDRVNQSDQQPPIGQFEQSCFTEYFVQLFLLYEKPLGPIRELLGKISDVTIRSNIMFHARPFTFPNPFIDISQFDQHPSFHELLSFSDKLLRQVQSYSSSQAPSPKESSLQEPLIRNRDYISDETTDSACPEPDEHQSECNGNNTSNEMIVSNASAFSDSMQPVNNLQASSFTDAVQPADSSQASSFTDSVRPADSFQASSFTDSIRPPDSSQASSFTDSVRPADSFQASSFTDSVRPADSFQATSFTDSVRPADSFQASAFTNLIWPFNSFQASAFTNSIRPVDSFQASAFSHSIRPVDSFQSDSGSNGSTPKVSTDRYLQQGARPKQPALAHQQIGPFERRLQAGRSYGAYQISRARDRSDMEVSGINQNFLSKHSIDVSLLVAQTYPQPSLPAQMWDTNGLPSNPSPISPANAFNAVENPAPYELESLNSSLKKLEHATNEYHRLAEIIELNRRDQEKDKEKIKKLTGQNEQLRELNQMLRTENQRLRIENEHSDTQKRMLNTQNQNLNVENHELTLKNQELNADSEGLRGCVAYFEDQNRSLTNQYSILMRELNQLRSENHRNHQTDQPLADDVRYAMRSIDAVSFAPHHHSMTLNELPNSYDDYPGPPSVDDMPHEENQQMAAACLWHSNDTYSAPCQQPCPQNGHANPPDEQAGWLNIESGRLPLQESLGALCEHYRRFCFVGFACCPGYFPCHRCHNDNKDPSCTATNKALHALRLKCSLCGYEGEINEDSQTCPGCGEQMSEYYCAICKHFTSTYNNPHHCDKCGICRIHSDRSYHCDVCGVCLDKRLLGNHKCRENSGHDECCICLEDAFGGCQILPCSHKVHKECAIAMINNGVRSCPVCRHPLFSQEHAHND
ncbi:CHY zinc finger protein [Endozoicomonas sp. 8E]|uniref:CHY zinc finger protein n=1 Tax=Endozoicomonas sp. 8E TaxID=3035692 RepID=UPI0029390FCA|nr:CHY zinc finger protein [Endozoicomonas sp. 8E]WOG27573.1 CHY zinc finger protein [Endozoicomonas sp. 8E]